MTFMGSGSSTCSAQLDQMILQECAAALGQVVMRLPRDTPKWYTVLAYIIARDLAMQTDIICASMTMTMTKDQKAMANMQSTCNLG